jgi:hypothetical protein
VDGYGEFVRVLAVVVGLAALTVGLAGRLRPVLGIVALLLAVFLGLFVYLLWVTGPSLTAAGVIALWTVGLMVPVVVVAVLLGAGAARLFAKVR